MKVNATSIWACGLTMLALTACENRVAMETTVHPDGRLDKQITLEVDEKEKNPERAFRHYIDSIQLKNWKRMDSAYSFQPKPAEGKKYISYQKHFSSAADANQHLGVPNDTLFRVTSSFKKKFRWFFTYITYSDTYHAINRLDLSHKDFFTEEDFHFINRLPAEGKPITSADSLYLKLLNEKITDHYGNQAFFEAYFSLLTDLVKRELPEPDWVEQLNANEERFYKMVLVDKDLADDFLQAFADSLGIPIRLHSLLDYKKSLKEVQQKINFVSSAYDGKYTHAIHMPWKIVSTNADSIAGNSAYWSPPAIKFLLNDYTLVAEARKTNYWAIGLTFVTIIGGAWLFRKR
jgi:hypothetical protein